MQVEAIAAPEGSICAKHPAAAGVFVCARCGDYACHSCATPRAGQALCFDCGEGSVPLPTELPTLLRFLYLSFDGRIDRQTWWLYCYLPSLAIQIGSAVLQTALTSEGRASYSLLVNLVTLPMLWPLAAMCVKRLHDRNQSGMWLLMLLAPIIGAIWFIVTLGLLRGDAGKNEYGPPPA